MASMKGEVLLRGIGNSTIRRESGENMVGVNMVLAEFVKFKDGLYDSCGIEWFEGIMLETCLLQPCFHVAGRCVFILGESSARRVPICEAAAWCFDNPHQKTSGS